MTCCEVGVNVDCTPVLDVAQAGMHAVIGTRSWSSDPGRVAAFGRAVAQEMLAGGVAPVIKHIPGHGRANVDSHLELPIVEASRAELEAHDFAPFMALADLPMAMTAHVVYSAIDPDRPATTSPIIVDEIIRGAIGFDGLLLSDDLSMKALGGPFAERTAGGLRRRRRYRAPLQRRPQRGARSRRRRRPSLPAMPCAARARRWRASRRALSLSMSRPRAPSSRAAFEPA